MNILPYPRTTLLRSTHYNTQTKASLSHYLPHSTQQLILRPKTMGIRYLYTNLRPYAHPATLAPDTEIFIDGPGMAHHVYEQCVRATASQDSQTTTANLWDSVIPYPVLQGAMIKYLHMLESCGVRMYCPSFLPSFLFAAAAAGR